MEKKVRMIANLLEDKHAKDIEIFELESKHPMFDTVLLASVDVERNLQAITNEFKKMEKDGQIEVKNYDLNNKDWALIDLYDVIVHIFVKDARQEYNLEEVLNEYIRNN